MYVPIIKKIGLPQRSIYKKKSKHKINRINTKDFKFKLEMAKGIGIFFPLLSFLLLYKFIYFNWRLFYNIVLVLPYVNMNLPQVYTCSPS